MRWTHKGQGGICERDAYIKKRGISERDAYRRKGRHGWLEKLHSGGDMKGAT